MLKGKSSRQKFKTTAKELTVQQIDLSLKYEKYPRPNVTQFGKGHRSTFILRIVVTRYVSHHLIAGNN